MFPTNFILNVLPVNSERKILTEGAVSIDRPGEPQVGILTTRWGHCPYHWSQSYVFDSVHQVEHRLPGCTNSCFTFRSDSSMDAGWAPGPVYTVYGRGRAARGRVDRFRLGARTFRHRLCGKCNENGEISMNSPLHHLELDFLCSGFPLFPLKNFPDFSSISSIFPWPFSRLKVYLSLKINHVIKSS